LYTTAFLYFKSLNLILQSAALNILASNRADLYYAEWKIKS